MPPGSGGGAGTEPGVPGGGGGGAGGVGTKLAAGIKLSGEGGDPEGRKILLVRHCMQGKFSLCGEYVPLNRLILLALSRRLSANEVGVFAGVAMFIDAGVLVDVIVGVAAYVGVAEYVGVAACVVLTVALPLEGNGTGA